MEVYELHAFDEIRIKTRVSRSWNICSADDLTLEKLSSRLTIAEFPVDCIGQTNS